MVDFERRSLGDMDIDNSGTGGSMEQAAVTGESSAGSRKHSVVGRVLVGLQNEKVLGFSTGKDQEAHPN